MQIEETSIRRSGDNSIEVVLAYRNSLINSLLEPETLNQFLLREYSVDSPSAIKLEFIKRALKELNASPVDLSHYGHLILEIKRSGEVVITDHHQKLFHQDIEKAIQNYLF